MSQVIFDCRGLTLYPMAGKGFRGGTEMAIEVLVKGLAAKGHVVHVVSNDGEGFEQRGPTEFWWSKKTFPDKADVIVMCPHLVGAEDYTGDALVLFSNGTDPWLGADGKLADLVAAFPVFSQTHGKLLCQVNPTVDQGKCVVTGLGVDLDNYDEHPTHWTHEAHGVRFGHKVPGRIWVGNDPSRGLWNVLDTFEIVHREYSEASLHVSYDFEAVFERRKWQHRAIAEMLWECERRLKTMPGVVNLGQLTPSEVVREQLEAMVHLWPSDPMNVGTQIHGISQAEAAAAGCALVLSDIEAFPEVFGEAATILPVIGKYEPTAERRCDAQDYADVVLELLRDPAKWAESSRKSRALAETMTWQDVIDRWDSMIEQLVGEEAKAA